MTASTAPITLPAKHRQDEVARSWPHWLVLLLGLLVQVAAWNVGDIADRRGRRHLIVLAIAAALPIVALVALAVLPA